MRALPNSPSPRPCGTRRPRRDLLFAALLLCGGCATHPVAQVACTQAQAMQAEAEAASLADWMALHASFGRYAQCDDATAGEGYSDSVSRLLADRWDSLDVLVRLTATDAAFERFVIGHIDDTVSAQRLARIVENSRSCPAGAEGLCRQIQDAARR